MLGAYFREWTGLAGAKESIMNKILTNTSKAAQKRHKCPKCGKYYVGYPALSRKDNKTKICPECGLKEAIVLFLESHDANVQ